MQIKEQITSRSNPLIKSAHSLKDRKERQKTGKFLVEGILHVGEASAAGWDIDLLLYSSELLSSEFARTLIDNEISRGVRCVPVSSDVLESLAEKDNPQGIVAVVEQRKHTIHSVSSSTHPLGVALVSPQDPGNVGTILRTVDAVGADLLFLLDGGVDPFHPSAVRASMGSLFWKPLIRTKFNEFTTWARENTYHLIGTSAHATVDYREIAPCRHNSILVLGNEQKGLSPEYLKACETTIKLPMHGRASSLNLAVAAGILMYSFFEPSSQKKK